MNANRRAYGLPEIPSGFSVCPRCKQLLGDDEPHSKYHLIPRWGWWQRAHESCEWADGSAYAPAPTLFVK